MASEEIESTMKRVQSQKGVLGYIVSNGEGIPIRSTLDNTVTLQYVNAVNGLVEKARRFVRDIEPANDLSFLRLRSKKHEIMVAPDNEFTLMVVQTPEA